MQKRNQITTGLRALGVAVLAVGLLATTAQESGPRVDKTSARDFKTTVSNVEKALKKEGMMIMAKIDHQNMLSMVGAKIKGSVTVEFGKPDMGKMMFAVTPAAGLEMPAKFYVYEDASGKTILSYYKPSVGFAAYKSEELNKVGAMMDMMLDKISTEATK